MTVAEQTPINSYVANGVTTVFAYSFLALLAGDITVEVTDTNGNVGTMVLGVDYTVTGVGSGSGGTVTFLTAPTNLYRVVIYRDTSLDRSVDYQDNGDLLADTVNFDFDRLWLAIQELFGSGRGTLNSLRVQAGETVNRLPAAAARIGKFLGFDAGGQPTMLSGTGADSALRTDLAANTGASLIGWLASGVGAVARALRTKLFDFETVEDYGAIGNGVTDDSAAFTAMAAAKAGAIVLCDRSYKVNGLNLSGTKISIRGVRKPSANAAFTALESGSILIGNVNIRATSCHLKNFGVDAGSASGLVSTTEGLVVDAPVGQRGKQLFAKNIAILGSLETSATHSLLAEGFDENTIRNIDVALRSYGVVVKGRNQLVRDVRGYRMGTCAVFVKSDVPASAGNVLDGTVQRASVKGVIHEANTTNNTAFAVYVLALTDAVSGVNVEDVQSLYGYGAVRIGGGGVSGLNVSAAQVSNITASNCVTALDLFGYTFDVKCKGVKALNPSSGNAVQTSGASTNWSMDGIDLLISDPLITATSPASFAGTGNWTNFTVRNPYRTMTIANSSTVLNGAHYGDVTCDGEGAPTMKANWSNSAAGYVGLKAVRIPGTNLVHLSGAASPTAGAGAVMCTLPAGVRPSAKVDAQSTNGATGVNSWVRIDSNGDVTPGAFTVGSIVVLNVLYQAG